MLKYIFICSFLFLGCKSVLSEEGATEVITIYGGLAKDSFDVRFDLLNDVKGEKELQKIVFYFDAGIKAGDKVRSSFMRKGKVYNNTLLVGIAHKGFFREKRRRDLMEDNGNMNQLLDSLIAPYIKKHYGWSKKRIVIGHSFGGLWVYRDFLKADTLFTNFVAISPSLWVGGTKKPSELKNKNFEKLANLTMYWGSKEGLNYVKGACEAFTKDIEAIPTLKKKVVAVELKGESHNSTPLPALKLYFDE